MEWKLFEGDKCEFASQEWYVEREAAHHLEQQGHRDRLLEAHKLVLKAIELGAKDAVDLGCGDGGMLSLLKDSDINSWGYDLAPNNIEHAINVRGVDARYTDFNNDDTIEYADIAIMTEVLEHLEDPHGVLKDLPSKYLVASSPFHETGEHHYEFHLWAWDVSGYKKLIEDAGYLVIETVLDNGSQIHLAVRN